MYPFVSSQADSNSLVQEDPDEEEGEFHLQPPSPKITKFQDAISSLEAVQTFLDSRGCNKDCIIHECTTYLHCASYDSARQSTLEDVFHSA